MSSINKKPIIAICYDFDKTLSPNDMQNFSIIPSFGLDINEFWKESNKNAEDNLMDKNLSWMYQILNISKSKNLSIRKDYFNKLGKDVKLYSGVENWFKRINLYGDKKGFEVQHYIISSGLKEIIEGTPISKEFKRIYASSYYYSIDGVAQWPAQAVNYTNKTQFIFRIAKGVFEEYDENVNKSFSKEELYIPYENFIYIGDSDTDIPCMRLVKDKGGFSIGVFDPVKNNRKKVYELFNDGRIDFFAAAKYTQNSDIDRIIHRIIDYISTKEKMNEETSRLYSLSQPYFLYKEISGIYEKMGKKSKKIDGAIEVLKNSIEGNID